MPDSWTCPGCSHEPFVRHFNYINHIRRSQLCRAAADAAAADAAAAADGAAAAEAAAFSPTAASPDPSRGDRLNSSVADDSHDDEDEVLCGVADDDVADDGFDAPASDDIDNTGSETSGEGDGEESDDVRVESGQFEGELGGREK